MLHRIAVAVVVAVVLTACGAEPSQDPPVSCPVIAGKFTARYTLTSTEGNCGGAKANSTDPMSFEDGKFVSPVDGIVRCTTKQYDCEVVVNCKTQVLAARLDFQGTLSADGTQLVGSATLKGSYQGCTSVSYDVDALMQGEAVTPVPE